jgi:glyceraldehyde-3-phosphate dehydrogenase/erythrose-4-phosphate dehydrogenase
MHYSKMPLQKKLKGILEYTEDPIVSTDIIGNDAAVFLMLNLLLYSMMGIW